MEKVKGRKETSERATVGVQVRGDGGLGPGLVGGHNWTDVGRS